MPVSYVNPIATEQLLIKVGDGATPEVFLAPALINGSRGYKGTTTEKTTIVPRTDDPSQPGKTVRKIVATDSEISGEGLINVGDGVTYEAWRLSGQPKNVKVYNNVTGALVVTGPYVLTDFTLTGSAIGEMVTCQLTLKQADMPTASTAP